MDQFVEAFSRHKAGRAMAAQLSQPFDQSKHKPESLIATIYALSGTSCCQLTNTCLQASICSLGKPLLHISR